MSLERVKKPVKRAGHPFSRNEKKNVKAAPIKGKATQRVLDNKLREVSSGPPIIFKEQGMVIITRDSHIAIVNAIDKILRELETLRKALGM
jgi:hypothetical protein